MKYTQNQGRIRASLEVEDKKIVFRFKNTCLEQKKDQHQDFFQKFKRGEYAKEINAEGSGLGLYLVKNTVEQYEGKVEGGIFEGHFVVRIVFGREVS